MELILYIIIFIGVLLAGLAKYARRRELSGKLGREVEDHELVSLNSWIEAETKEDRKKGIAPKTASVRKTAPDVVHRSGNSQPVVAEVVREVIDKSDEPPNNCGRCGAALSKELSHCQFCGAHSSRKALEEHASVFLDNLKTDFEAAIPAFHGLLRFGCVAIPLLTLAGTIIGYFLMPPARAGYAFLFGVPLLSLIAAYIWMTVVDTILTRKEGVIFEHLIEPKIRHFIKGNQLQPLELVSLAKRHQSEHSKLLEHIYRRF